MAALTHGHANGYVAAGAMAVMVAALTAGSSIEDAVEAGRVAASGHPQGQEVEQAIATAVNLAESGDPSPEKVELLGGGWVAEEALAMGVYVALVHPFEIDAAIRLAVNHSGDSDSTGSICGQLVGTALGVEAISDRWLKDLELADVIDRIATDLHDAFIEGKEIDWDRYPGY
jgi:ADP-ribosylglycohydrolase